MPVLLDHSIVGQSLTDLQINKEREYAACRICGAIFQSWLNTLAVSDVDYAADPTLAIAAAVETREWRQKHNKRHSEKEHAAFNASGLTFTPEAAHRLAPFGLVSLDFDADTADAMLKCPRAPVDDVETTLKGWC